MSQGAQNYEVHNVFVNLLWEAQTLVHQKTYFVQPWGLKTLFQGVYGLQKYVLVVQAWYTWVKIYSCFMAWLETFCSLFYQANEFDSQVEKQDFVGIIIHGNYSLKVRSIFCLIWGCYDFETMVWCMHACIYNFFVYIIAFYIMHLLFSWSVLPL